MTARRRFPATLDSVADARRFTLGALAGQPAELQDAVVLMVSELTTNALVHALSAFEVTIRQEGGIVRVEVSDAGGGEPELLSPGSTEPHGRGLRIVDRLADAWGAIDSPSGGKSIWFTLGPPADAVTQGASGHSA